MNKRQRVISMLRGQKPDKVPWFADLAYWIDYLNDVGRMPDKYLQDQTPQQREVLSTGLAAPFNGPGLIQLHKDLNTGFYLQGYFPFYTVYDDQVQAETKLEGNRKITSVKTPYGNMREIWEYIFATHSWGPREFMLKDSDDIKKYQYLYEHTSYLPDYGTAKARADLVKEIGVNLVYMPKSPLMELVALHAGIEAVTYMIADDEGEFADLMMVMRAKHDEACEIALNAPAECIMIPENLSSDTISPRMYRQYCADYAAYWTDRIRKAGKFSFVHLDGVINPLLTEVSNIGFDVVEGLTPAPVGDLAFEQLRPITKNNAILWGGIPSGYFGPSVSDADFDTYVIRLIRQMAADGRSVLAVGDQVVPGAEFARIARVHELVEQYGSYEDVPITKENEDLLL